MDMNKDLRVPPSGTPRADTLSLLAGLQGVLAQLEPPYGKKGHEALPP